LLGERALVKPGLELSCFGIVTKEVAAMRVFSMVLLFVAIAQAGILLANGGYKTYDTSPAKPDCAFTVDTAGTHIEDCEGADWYAVVVPPGTWKYVKDSGPETAYMNADGTYSVYHSDGTLKETGK